MKPLRRPRLDMPERSLDAAPEAFYREVLGCLVAGRVPFLVGGAFAFHAYTGIERDTKDLDLFLRAADYPRAAEVLERAGHATELTYPHWLGKVTTGQGLLVDLIFSSGNGVAAVDDAWFAHAHDAVLLDVPVRIAPPEETIWSKAFVMERERYDGADVAHLLRARHASLDWQRLVQRFGERHFRVLLAHLLLFGFVYPGERDAVPAWVMESLLERARREVQRPAGDGDADAAQGDLCQGTLLSREQYLPDVTDGGLRDARLAPEGAMSAAQIAHWTRGIDAAP